MGCRGFELGRPELGHALDRGLSNILAGLSVALVLCVSGAAFAQNQGTFEQQEACKPDVFRLCGNYIPDADRITACLREAGPQLSPPCHDVFFPPQPEEPKKKSKSRRER